MPTYALAGRRIARSPSVKAGVIASAAIVAALAAPIAIDARVPVFAAVTAAIASVAAGVLPVLQARRLDLSRVLFIALPGLVAIALVVGGIVIMNIMLVSVMERTREIGVRKALGATKNNILLQFLIEAVVLCCLGGIIGIAVGAGGAMVLSKAFQWNTSVSPSAIGLAFAFSAGVGVLFGVWPARRAASLDPIVALRYE